MQNIGYLMVEASNMAWESDWTMRKMAEMREGEKHLFENLVRAICAVANG